MASNESPDFDPTPDEEESARIRRKLLWRMGVAGSMIVALLGGLALFDYLATGSREPEYASPHFTDPVPVSPRPVTQALGPIMPVPDEEDATESPPEALDVSVPESTEAPAIPAGMSPEDAVPPPSPEAHPRPATSRARAKPSSRAATAALPPSVRSSTPSPLPPSAGRAEGEAPASPRPETEAPRAESPRAEASPPLPSRQAATLPRPRPLSGYTLQAGVFADPRRAEEIHTRLVQEGIPVTLETRVLVGPFRNRNEAESARAKMKAMGIDALLMPRNGRK
jgi:cell division protein FtsN